MDLCHSHNLNNFYLIFTSIHVHIQISTFRAPLISFEYEHKGNLKQTQSKLTGFYKTITSVKRDFRVCIYLWDIYILFK